MKTNTKQPQHTVCLTLDGRYAVVTPGGETLGEFHDEALALQTAAQLDNGPVRNVCAGGGRWDSLKAGHQTGVAA